MFDYDYDYKEKPKKKKKHEKEEEKNGLKAKPVRNFKIIDDDIDINSLNPSEDVEAFVDLLDPEGPAIAEMDEFEKFKMIQKEKSEIKNVEKKWIKLDNQDGFTTKGDSDQEETSVFRKRGEKSGNKQINNEDSRQFDQDEDDYDDDLDMIPRRKIKKEADYNDDDDLDLPRPKRAQAVDDDDDLDVPRPKRVQDVDDNDDLDMIRRKRSTNNDGDLSPVRRRKESIEDDVDVTKVRQRKTTKEEEYKKAKKEEKLLKYMEWGKGLVQKKERDEKLAEAVYEADKPLARYKDDKDLERLLKEQEREEDPMLEYIRKNKDGFDSVKSTKAKYRGPPAPPNRYNLLPGPRWDGVDRSNGFEKKYYESITAKKALQDEAYKWSTEDM